MEIIEIREKVIIRLHRMGGGIERNSTYYIKCRAKCCSILKYLLYIYNKGGGGKWLFGKTLHKEQWHDEILV